MTAMFVSPAELQPTRLSQAMTSFAQARNGAAAAKPYSAESWRNLAFTAKPDLRTDLHAYPGSGRRIALLCSSGTTAEPVFSPWSDVDQQIADHTARQIHSKCPSIEGARCAVIAPDGPMAVVHFMRREIEVCGGIPCLIKPDEPEAMWRRLIDEGVDVAFTLPLLASRLGEYFRATRGQAPEGINLLFCAGDLLSSARQSMLAAMWDAQVFNMFGCSELFGPVAGPAEAGFPLVWQCEPVAVEVIDPATLSPCAPRQRGVLVLTTLWPKASPLLRYWTDDVVEVVTAAGVVDQEFRFNYIGRPPSMLWAAGRQVALLDIDTAMLGSGWCGSEWSITQTPHGICVEAEMRTRGSGKVRALADTLAEIIGAPVELVPREPYSLPRVAPKFTVTQATR